MLMITEQRSAEALTFHLAGMLVGDWAIEFEHCWLKATSSTTAAHIRVDLTEVTFVDEAGKGLLSRMMKAGTDILARDVLMRAIVKEIADASAIA